MKTVIVLPTYNEIDNLRPMTDALRDSVPDAHVLVVDDSSPDGTGRLADEISAASGGRVHVLHRTAKEGLGKAYLAGFRWALARDYAAVVQMDCDFSHDPKTVPLLLSTLAACDVAIGSRYVPGGGTVNWGLVRRLISRGGSAYARLVLRVPYRDLTGGFKAWKRETLDAIRLDRVDAQGYVFQVEMTYRAHELGKKVVEVPITFVDRRVGQSKMSKKIVLEAVIRCWSIRAR